MDFPFFCKFTQIADETIVVFFTVFRETAKKRTKFQRNPVRFCSFYRFFIISLLPVWYSMSKFPLHQQHLQFHPD